MAKTSQQRQPLNVEEGAKLPLPDVGADSNDLADYVVTNWAVQDDHYRGLYQQWMKVLFFIVGKHHVKWDENRSVYVPDTDVPPWRQQPVTNITFAVFRTLVAKLTKNKPTSRSSRRRTILRIRRRRTSQKRWSSSSGATSTSLRRCCARSAGSSPRATSS
jgi:hypothetical protein